MLSAWRAGGCIAISAVAIASFHAPACAASASPDTVPVVSGPLTLERALELASRYELRLRAAGLRAEAVRARIMDASRRPNPTLSATEENFGGDLGGDHREGTLALAQAFELGGDRKARKAAAEAEYRLASADSAVLGRESLALTSDRFITAWALQTRLRRLEEGELVTEQAIRAATERHRAGASPQLEIIRAQSQAMAQAVERQRTESELHIARQELALRWGTVHATFDSLVPPEHAAVIDTTGWGSRPLTHPELNRASATEALATARLQAASAARIPDLTISGGLRRLEEVRGTGFLIGMELPLPLWNSGAGVTAAQRELEASAADRRATEQQIQVGLAAAAERFQTAAALYDALSQRVRPAREQLVQEMLRSYRSGRSSYLDLVAEQRNLLETEMALIDAKADLWRAQMHLELLLGTGLLVPKEER